MPPKSDIEMARLAIAKVTRKEIRTKYELLADVELNEVLPKRLAEFDRLVQDGLLPSLEFKLLVSSSDPE